MEILQISKGSNNHADSLATMASLVANPLPRIVSVELLPYSSVIPSDKDIVLSIHLPVSWIDPIIAYLWNGTLPEDRKEAKRTRCRSPRYWVSEEGKSYKSSYSSPYLLCMHPKVEVILEELYEGICRSHTRGRSLAHHPYSRILVVEHAETSRGFLQKMWSVPKVFPWHSLAMGSS